MIAEEIALNDHLEANGIEPIETDLGEYIIQLRQRAAEPHHRPGGTPDQGPGRGRLPRPPRPPAGGPQPGRAGAAGRRGARGPARALRRGRRRDHRRQLPDRRDRLLGHRHQRGQRRPDPDPAQGAHRHRQPGEGRADPGGRPRHPAGPGPLGDRARSSPPTPPSRPGPSAPEDPDGPEEYHVVLLDNGRSGMLGTEFQDALRCIRCGACMNHCPVYHAIGGHAYGWVYPGPIGAVLTPSLIGVEEAGHLPNASTFCGRCESGLPDAHPAAQDDAPLARARVRAAPLAGCRARRPGLWAFFARRPGSTTSSPDSRPGRWRAGPAPGPLPQPAPGRRLDRAPRPSGAPGPTFQQLWAQRQKDGQGGPAGAA